MASARGARVTRKRNPVPASSAEEQVQDAAAAYKRFTGMDADEVMPVTVPPLPKAMWPQGFCDAIQYTAVRDGVTEYYEHKFRKDCRPLLCVSPDNKTLYLVGGSFEVTELGIVDKP